MNPELTIAQRYFLYPSPQTSRAIPRAGMIGLALSITVLMATLSVMNGFEKQFEDDITSRIPHLSSQTLSLEKAHELQQKHDHVIEKVGHFIQAQMIIPNWNHVPVTLYISDDYDQVQISTRLAQRYGWSPGQNIELFGFSQKKVFGKIYPQSLQLKPQGLKEDSIYALYIPYSQKDILRSVQRESLTAMWLFEPLKAPQLKEQLRDQEPDVFLSTWQEHYGSLFKALQAEKRLVSVVLSLLIILIFFQLNLTMLLIFKDKEKDMVTLYCFLNGSQSIRRVFSYYAAFNILTGIFLGAIFGTLLSFQLPAIVKFLEQLFSFEVLPYSGYNFSALPSTFLLSDLIHVVLFSLILGGICSRFLVNKLAQKDILSVLNQQK